MTIDQLDNPTEWGGIIGTAILHPERREEMERKVELKAACSFRALCGCGTPLDQRTAWLTKIDGRAAGITCRPCFLHTINTALDSARNDTDAETVRANVRRSITARTWKRDYTGAEILELIGTPKRTKPKAADSKWYTPAEIESSCQGWTPGAILVIEPRYILRPDSRGRRKLEKRAPNGIQNTERFPRLIGQAEDWLSLREGARLTEGPTTDDDGRPQTEMRYTDGNHCCDMGAKILRTVEHYCGAGYWTEAPADMFIVYRTPAGTPAGLAARMIDRSKR